MSRKPKKDNEPAEELSLPPSGLAEDIFKMMEESEAPRTEARELAPIYAFADSLQVADAEEEEKAAEQLETWVTFALDSEIFSLPVSHIQEILRVGSITRVPHAPHPVRGITNMRGRVLPVVDLRLRIGLKESSIGVQSRILVAATHGRLIGLLVDSVQQVLRLDRRRVQPPPPDVMTAQSDYIMGVYHVQNSLIILLDVEQILTVQDSNITPTETPVEQRLES